MCCVCVCIVQIYFLSPSAGRIGGCEWVCDFIWFGFPSRRFFVMRMAMVQTHNSLNTHQHIHEEWHMHAPKIHKITNTITTMALIIIAVVCYYYFTNGDSIQCEKELNFSASISLFTNTTRFAYQQYFFFLLFLSFFSLFLLLFFFFFDFLIYFFTFRLITCFTTSQFHLSIRVKFKLSTIYNLYVAQRLNSSQSGLLYSFHSIVYTFIRRRSAVYGYVFLLLLLFLFIYSLYL